MKILETKQTKTGRIASKKKYAIPGKAYTNHRGKFPDRYFLLMPETINDLSLIEIFIETMKNI